MKRLLVVGLYAAVAVAVVLALGAVTAALGAAPEPGSAASPEAPAAPSPMAAASPAPGEESAGSGLWATFDRLEARFLRGDVVASEEWQQVIDMAVQQLSRRMEPRSLALLQLTRLIAEVRQGRPPQEIEATYGDLLGAMYHVRHDVTIYSQFQRYNMTREAFSREVQDFYDRSQASGGTRRPARRAG